MSYLYKVTMDKNADPPTYTVRIYDLSQNYLGLESSAVYEAGLGVAGVFSAAAAMAQTLVDSIVEQPDPEAEHQALVTEIEGFETTLDVFTEIGESPTHGP